jgi:hypothetical protein
MNIHADVKELTLLKQEIERLSKELNKLRKNAKIKEENIINFLKHKEQKGLKFEDKALILNEKQSLVSKPKKDKEENYIKILSAAGVSNPKRVLSDMMNSGKQNKETYKIKIQNVNKK